VIEIRSTKSETNSKKKIQMTKTQPAAVLVIFLDCPFEFVSDFVLRISDFR